MVNGEDGIEVRIKIDTTDFDKGIDKSKQRFNELEESGKKIANEFEASMQKPRKAMNDVNNTAKEVGRNVKGLGENFKNSGETCNKSFTNLSNTLNKLKERFKVLGTGISDKIPLTIDSIKNKLQTMGGLFGNAKTKAQTFVTELSRGKQEQEGLNNSVNKGNKELKNTETQIKRNTTLIEEGNQEYKRRIKEISEQRNNTAKLNAEAKEHEAIHREIHKRAVEIYLSTQDWSSAQKAYNKYLAETETEHKKINKQIDEEKTKHGEVISELKEETGLTKELSSSTRMSNVGVGGWSSGKEIKSLTDSVNSAVSSNSAYRDSFYKINDAVKLSESRLSRYKNTLRSFSTITRTIGSLLVWDMAFGLIEVASDTTKAKSEMESFQTVMKMGPEQVWDFNNALDETLENFPKINKYNLGETVASIGTEFGLTTEQMKKAMPVFSMVTNEYLRAGRSQEDAALAMKDVSQGEFQRLSRETGVGKEELKAHGWSGNTMDIVTLLDALDEVGHSRNWDVIASKAESISDITLILQNRWGEFATYISDTATPWITGAFNLIADGLSGVMNQFNTNPVFRWGAGITAGLVALKPAIEFVKMFREQVKTLGTVQLSHILGLDEETVRLKGFSAAMAEASSKTAYDNLMIQRNIDKGYEQALMTKESELAQRLYNEGLSESASAELACSKAMKGLTNAEKQEAIVEALVAEGTDRVTASKIAEEAVTKSATLAENQKAIANELESDTLKGVALQSKAKQLAVEAEMVADETGISISEAKTYVIKQENAAQLSNTKALLAHTMGLQTDIVQQEGWLTAAYARLNGLNSLEHQTKLTEFAEQSFGTRLREVSKELLTNHKGLLLAGAGVIGLAVALGELYKSTSNNRNIMKKFNDSVENMNGVVADYDDRLQVLNNTLQTIQGQTKGLSKSSKEYKDLKKQESDTRRSINQTKYAKDDYVAQSGKLKNLDAQYKAQIEDVQKYRSNLEYAYKAKHDLLTSDEKEAGAKGYDYAQTEAYLKKIEERYGYRTNQNRKERDDYVKWLQSMGMSEKEASEHGVELQHALDNLSDDMLAFDASDDFMEQLKLILKMGLDYIDIYNEKWKGFMNNLGGDWFGGILEQVSLKKILVGGGALIYLLKKLGVSIGSIKTGVKGLVSVFGKLIGSGGKIKDLFSGILDKLGSNKSTAEKSGGLLSRIFDKLRGNKSKADEVEEDVEEVADKVGGIKKNKDKIDGTMGDIDNSTNVPTEKTGKKLKSFKEWGKNLGANLQTMGEVFIELAIGIAMAAALITEALYVMQAPLWALAEVGKYYKGIEDNVKAGTEGIKEVGNALLALGPAAAVMIVAAGAFIKMGLLGTVGAKMGLVVTISAFLGIGAAIVLMTEALRGMELPLWALSEVGKKYTGMEDNVKKGADGIKVAGEALKSVASAMSSLATIIWADLKTDIANFLKGYKDTEEELEELTSESGDLTAISNFGKEFNDATKDMVTINPEQANAFKSIADTLKTLSDALKNMNDALSNLGDVLTNTTSAETGTGITLTDKLKTLKETIKTLNEEFAEPVSKYTFPALGPVATGLQSTATVISKITTAMNNIKTAVNAYNGARTSTGNHTGGIKDLLGVDSGLSDEITDLRRAIYQTYAFATIAATYTFPPLAQVNTGLQSTATVIATLGTNLQNVQTAVGQISAATLEDQFEKIKTAIDEIIEFRDEINDEDFTNEENGGSDKLIGLTDTIDAIVTAVTDGASDIAAAAASWEDSGKKISSNFASGILNSQTTVAANMITLVSSAMNVVKNRYNTFKSAGTASGKKVGEGFKAARPRLVTIVIDELKYAITAIQNRYHTFYSAGVAAGKAFVSGYKSSGALAVGSPGAIARATRDEVNYALAAANNGVSGMYNQGVQLGSNFVNGFSSNSSLNNLSNQTNALVNIGDNYSTVTNGLVNGVGALDNAYTGLGVDVNTTLNGINTNSQDAFNRMGVNVSNGMNQIKNTTTTGFNNATRTTTTGLRSMQSSTVSTTKRMVSAWESMRGNIVRSAKMIQSQSYTKFKSLHSSIKSFYNQLANASFSSGLAMGYRPNSYNTHNGRRVFVGTTKDTGGRLRFSGGGTVKKPHHNYYGASTSKSFLELLRKGDSKAISAFNLINSDCKGDDCYYGSVSSNTRRIRDYAYPWTLNKLKWLGYDVGNGDFSRTVKEFDIGNYKIRWSEFEPLLTNLISQHGINYEYYANGKYSNQQVWDGHQCNCWDGAELLIELAKMAGFNGHLVHGDWNGESHMGAMINGTLFDMTQFSSRGVWRGTPGVHFGHSPSKQHYSSGGGVTHENKEINVTINMSGATIYGVDDLEDKMQGIADKVFIEYLDVNPATGV